MASTDPTFFSSPAALRAWLAEHHASERELLVGLYKKESGKASITWPELVDELLCVGWIDGIRKRIDDESYSIRITPRRPGSIWSALNLRHIERLRAEGRLTPAGEAAAAVIAPERVYSFEQGHIAFEPAQETMFRAQKDAWTFFRDQAPSYQRSATWFVTSAKKDETRARRLALVIECSARSERLPQFSPGGKKAAARPAAKKGRAK